MTCLLSPLSITPVDWILHHLVFFLQLNFILKHFQFQIGWLVELLSLNTDFHMFDDRLSFSYNFDGYFLFPFLYLWQKVVRNPERIRKIILIGNVCVEQIYLDVEIFPSLPAKESCIKDIKYKRLSYIIILTSSLGTFPLIRQSFRNGLLACDEWDDKKVTTLLEQTGQW